MKTNTSGQMAIVPRKISGVPVDTKRITREKVVQTDLVIVTVCIPKDALDALDHDGEYLTVPLSCSIEHVSQIEIRMAQWGKSFRTSAGWNKARKVKVAELVAQGLDHKVEFLVEAVEWALVCDLAEMLNITPGDWILSGVARAVERRDENRMNRPLPFCGVPVLVN